MKTLVIHPYDPTTVFMNKIYKDRDWEVVDYRTTRQELVDKIVDHERILIIGHGTPMGLLGHSGYVLDHTFADILREKYLVAIWCNCDQFFVRYNLNGFYTGMIISEVGEAYACGIPTATQEDVTISNTLFCNTIKINMDDMTKTEKIINDYAKYEDQNLVIQYNKERIYHR